MTTGNDGRAHGLVATVVLRLEVQQILAVGSEGAFKSPRHLLGQGSLAVQEVGQCRSPDPEQRGGLEGLGRHPHEMGPWFACHLIKKIKI